MPALNTVSRLVLLSAAPMGGTSCWCAAWSLESCPWDGCCCRDALLGTGDPGGAIEGYRLDPPALLPLLLFAALLPVCDGWRPADMGLYMMLLVLVFVLLLQLLLPWWNRALLAAPPRLCSLRSLTVASHSRPLLGGSWLRRTSVGQRVQVSAARGSGMPQMFCAPVGDNRRRACVCVCCEQFCRW